MYICLCNGIRASELQTLRAEGVRDGRDAFARLDAEPHCRSCVSEVEAILKGAPVFGKAPSGEGRRLKLVG